MIIYNNTKRVHRKKDRWSRLKQKIEKRQPEI
jgi:hypothetical protein